MTQALDLESYLKAEGIWYRFLEKPQTVHTADASVATGIELNRITKNLVSKTSDGSYLLLIVPGNRRVDLQKAAKAVNARNVQLLGFREAEIVSGYVPGATPSIFHKTPLKIVIDRSLLSYETIHCGGGSRNRLLELKTQDVLKLTGAISADISE
jgi:Cys-tRNA(Pro)/Cys-tRNA(Cys) deacylase